MWTKICGFKDPETAALAADLGASAIGLNFFEESARATDVETAREIVGAVDGKSMCVGLFVNEPIESLIEKVGRSKVDAIQLHGDEPPEYLIQLLGELPQHGIIKAFPIDEVGLHMVAQYLDRCAMLGGLPWACLIDARVSGMRGGTGQVAPWHVVQEQYREQWPYLILAGGLNSSNVAAAVEQVEPWGLDIASGAEVERGVKDPERIRELLSLTAGL